MTSKIIINNVSLTFLGHSGFIIEENNNKIVIDPFITGNPFAKIKPESIKATDIIISHAHQDHIGDSISIAKNNNCSITSTFEVVQWAEKQGVKTNYAPIGSTVKLPFGNVVFRPAIHANNVPESLGFPVGFPSSVLLQLQGLKIFHLADTALNLDFKLVQEVYTPDVIIVPIGGHYTMNIDEAVIACSWFKAKYVIPVHYNTFPQIEANPLEFKEKLVKASINSECVILDPLE